MPNQQLPSQSWTSSWCCLQASLKATIGNQQVSTVVSTSELSITTGQVFHLCFVFLHSFPTVGRWKNQVLWMIVSVGGSLVKGVQLSRNFALVRPVESQFGARGNYAHSRGSLQAASPRGIAGPLRHCGAWGSLPPLDGPSTSYQSASIGN